MITWMSLNKGVNIRPEVFEYFAVCMNDVITFYRNMGKPYPRLFGNAKFLSLCPNPNPSCKNFNLYPIEIKELEEDRFKEYQNYPYLYFVDENDSVSTILYYREEYGIRIMECCGFVNGKRVGF